MKEPTPAPPPFCYLVYLYNYYPLVSPKVRGKKADMDRVEVYRFSQCQSEKHKVCAYPLFPFKLSNSTLSRAQWQPFHRLLKYLQRQRGRVERNLVASPKYPQETEIVLRLECPARCALDLVADQLFCFEVRLARESNGFGGHLIPDPVADIVCVSSPLWFESSAKMSKITRAEGIYHDSPNTRIDNVR